jgi:hypothetical protein
MADVGQPKDEHMANASWEDENFENDELEVSVLIAGLTDCHFDACCMRWFFNMQIERLKRDLQEIIFRIGGHEDAVSDPSRP